MPDRWWKGNAPGDETNWHNADNWGAAEAPGGGAGVPTAADDAKFSNTSGAGNCSLTANAECRHLYTASAQTGGTDNWTGNLNCATFNLSLAGNFGFQSNGTWTMGSGTITVAGTLTLVTGLTVSRGTSHLILNGNTNAAGKHMHRVTFASSLTVLNANLSVYGEMNILAGVTVTIEAARIIYLYGSPSTIDATGVIIGDGTLYLYGVGIEGLASTGTISAWVIMATAPGETRTAPARAYAGTVTLRRTSSGSGSTTVRFGAGTWTIGGDLLLDCQHASDNITLDCAQHNPDVTVAGDLDFVGVGAGEERILLGNGTWTVGGATVDFTGGTVTPGNSTLVLTGNGAVLTPAGNPLYGLTVQHNWRVVGALNVTNLYRCITPGRTLTWPVGVTHTLADIDLQGTAANPLVLASGTPGTAFAWNVAAAPQAAVTGVRVSDCNASAGATIGATGSRDGGNVLNWDFNMGRVVGPALINRERLLGAGQWFEFPLHTWEAASAGIAAADALPVWDVYEEGSDTVVASGTCAVRGGIGGYYVARGEITAGGGYALGGNYVVRVFAVVDGTAGAEIVGAFRVVPADMARADQWTNTRAGYLDAAITSREAAGAAAAAVATLENLSQAEAQAAAEAATAVIGAQTNALMDTAPRRSWFRVAEWYPGNPLQGIALVTGTGTTHPKVRRYVAGGYNYRMYYTPYPGWADEDPCLVRSVDGITWTDAGVSNPLIPSTQVPGDWNCGLADPDVVYVPDYSLWFMVIRGDQWLESLRPSGIALATSADGLTWSIYAGAPVNGNTNPIILAGDDDGGSAAELYNGNSAVTWPTILYDGGTFYLHYGMTGGEGPNRSTVHLATFEWNPATGSVENLVRNPGNPILSPPADAYWQAGQGHQSVFRLADGTYGMYCHRVLQGVDAESANPLSGLEFYTSSDLINWRSEGLAMGPDETNPLNLRGPYNGGPVLGNENVLAAINGRVRYYFVGMQATALAREINLAFGRGNLDESAHAVWAAPTRTITGTALGADDRLVVLTLEDGGGNPVIGIPVHVYLGSDPNPLVGVTGIGGVSQWALPDGAYTVVYGPAALFSFANPYALTVAGNTAATHVCTALAIPASVNPELCACFLDVRAADGGGLVGENEAWLEILRIEAPLWPVALDEQTAALGRSGQTYYTDENGRIVVELVRGAQVRLQVGTGTPAAPREEKRLSLTVPDAASYRINTEEA